MTDETLDRIDAAILAWLASLNTRTTGYVGLALVIASYLAPVLVPRIDLWIASLGFPAIVVHALVAIVGGLAALLGRWRTFAPPSDVAADVPRPLQPVAAASTPLLSKGYPVNPQSEISAVLSILGLFFGSNPTVQEVEIVLPQVMNAIANEKSGQSFGVSIPLSLNGVKGNASFSWSPATVSSAPAAAA